MNRSRMSNRYARMIAERTAPPPMKAETPECGCLPGETPELARERKRQEGQDRINAIRAEYGASPLSLPLLRNPADEYDIAPVILPLRNRRRYAP